MLRYRTGVAGSAAGGMAIARYLTGETLRPDNEALAQYYAGETIPENLTGLEALGRAVADGEVSFSMAANELISAHGRMFGYPDDVVALEDRVSHLLLDATNRADMREAVAAEGGTVAGVRGDLDPRLAQRLGIDVHRPPTTTEIAHLLSGLRADGGAIEGRQIQKPMRSVAEVFGLDDKRLPSADEITQVLAGRRVDGETPRSVDGKPLADTVVQGARKRFLAAYDMASGQEPTAEQIAHFQAGRTANGGGLNHGDVLWKLNATKAPVSYVDMIWSADKSLSVAWALANTAAERSMILQAHKSAVASAMAHAENQLGFTTKGKGGRNGVERGVTAWVTFDHYTARPTAEIARIDSKGQAYTDFQDVPMRTADMQLHTHATMLNAVMTDAGRVGAMDLDGLDGLVKELGATYQAFLGRNLRAHGIDVRMDRTTGAAVVMAVPTEVTRHFSKRSQDVQAAARAYAAAEGVDWDSLTPARQIGLLRKGVEETRHEKGNRDGRSDFLEWRTQALDEIGYRHRSVLRPDAIKPELSQDQRRVVAYEISLELIEAALSKRAKLGSQDFREFAARGLVEAGISDTPGQDIKAIMQMYRQHGVRQDGEMTTIWFGKDIPVRGKERWSVTTELHAAGERDVVALARTFAADQSVALTPAAIEHAAQTFLAAHPDIDPSSDHWKAQRAVIDGLSTGGRFGIAVGVAGAGKSTLMGVVTQAMRDEGREVYGIGLGWKQANALTGAGIEPKNIKAVEAFLNAARKGKLSLDRNSVVILEEISQVGRPQMLKLLKLQQGHGFTLLAIGDPKQIGSIEAPVVDLLIATLGDKVPEILTSVRQRTEREREISDLFRNGQAGEAIAMKREDKTAELVAGGRGATVQRIATRWHELVQADPSMRPTIGVASNRDAHDIGMAIRQRLQEAGTVGADQIELATLMRGETGLHKLPLASGDRIRVFNRVWSEGHFASNGDVVDVMAVSAKGMTARNDAGREAFIEWGKLQQPHEPAPRLAYGHALTIDAAQGITSRVHIDAIVSGSAAHAGGKGYVNESRQTETTLMIVNEAAERKKIASCIPRGEFRPIRDADIWQHVANNINRPTTKAGALEFLHQGVDLRRGTTWALPTCHEPAERHERAGYDRTLAHHHRQRIALERSPIIQQVMDVARDLQQRAAHRVRQIVEPVHRPSPDHYRGPSLGR